MFITPLLIGAFCIREMIMLSKLNNCATKIKISSMKVVNTAQRKIGVYQARQFVTKAVAEREARISGLKAYIRMMENTPSRERAINKIKMLEVEISMLLGELSKLQQRYKR